MQELASVRFTSIEPRRSRLMHGLIVAVWHGAQRRLRIGAADWRATSTAPQGSTDGPEDRPDADASPDSINPREYLETGADLVPGKD